MIIIQVAGGLGNQLQQYALYSKFIHLGTEAALDLSWFSEGKKGRKSGVKTATERKLELNYFEGLDYRVCTKEEKERLVGNSGLWGKFRRKLLPFTVHWFKERQIYYPELLKFKNMYISGYFACEKYYSDILKDLREKIKFPISTNPANMKMAEEINREVSVSIHVRRGDYLMPENAAMFGNICTEKYYERAVGLIKEMVPGAHFYLFSDDISYVSQKFKGEEYSIVNINHGKDGFYDMWLMSQCRHHICANSTFSFWGARLNENDDKIMIRPAIQKNGQIFVKEEMEELWKGWRFIDSEGTLM